MAPRQTSSAVSLTTTLDFEKEFRTAFPPWSTFDISKPVQNAVARSQPKIKAYRRKGYQAFRRLFPQRALILALPDELIVEIFKAVGWREVLYLRECCKRLERISRAKDIWLSQVEQLSLAWPVAPRLEGLPSAYSAQEVEDFVLSRISADIGWCLGKEPQPVTISPWPESHLPKCQLVEGGRWLLIVDDLSRVYAKDLDSSLEKEPELIIDSDGPEGDTQYQCCIPRVDLDRNEPILTFNLSLLPFATINHPGLVSRLKIYRIQMTGHGDEAKLVPRLLKSLPFIERGASFAQGLSGHLFARTFDQRTRSWIEVYDWTASNQTTQFGAAIREPRSNTVTEDIAILPGSKLLACRGASFTIYRIVRFGVADNESFDVEGTLEISWKYDFGSTDLGYFLSRPLDGSTATRITMSNWKQIYGVIVPHDGTTPSTHLLFEHSRGEMLTGGALGINKAYAESEECSCIINLVWPDDHRVPPVPLGDKRIHFFHWPFKVAGGSRFDEGSGRIIISIDDGRLWKVLYFDRSRRKMSVHDM